MPLRCLVFIANSSLHPVTTLTSFIGVFNTMRYPSEQNITSWSAFFLPLKREWPNTTTVVGLANPFEKISNPRWLTLSQTNQSGLDGGPGKGNYIRRSPGSSIVCGSLYRSRLSACAVEPAAAERQTIRATWQVAVRRASICNRVSFIWGAEQERLTTLG